MAFPWPYNVAVKLVEYPSLQCRRFLRVRESFARELAQCCIITLTVFVVHFRLLFAENRFCERRKQQQQQQTAPPSRHFHGLYCYLRVVRL